MENNKEGVQKNIHENGQTLLELDIQGVDETVPQGDSAGEEPVYSCHMMILWKDRYRKIRNIM